MHAAVQGVLGESASVDVTGRDAAARGRYCRPSERRATTGLILTEATHVPGGLGVGRYHCPTSACKFGPAFGLGPACRFGLVVCGLGLLVRGLDPTCGLGLLACGLGPTCGLSLVVRGLDPTCGLGLLACGLDPTCRCGVISGFCPACGLDTRFGSRPPHGAHPATRYRPRAPLSAT